MRIPASRARALGLSVGKTTRAPAGVRPKKAAPPVSSAPERKTPVRIEVAGDVVAKARQRTVGGGAHSFTPDATATYARRVRQEAVLAMRGTGPFRGPLEVEVEVYHEPPGSWSRTRRERAVAGEIVPTGKPDWDNLGKNACDAVEGIAFLNDSQIVDVVLRKRYARRGRIVFTIRPLPLEPAYRK